MIDLLSFEDALAIIDELEFTIVDAGLLASAIARPTTTVFGADAYPDLTTKVAALLHSVARNHALLDGNKRTAWVMARVSFALNGVVLRSDDGEAETFMVEVAQGDHDVDAIGKWLTDHIHPGEVEGS